MMEIKDRRGKTVSRAVKRGGKLAPYVMADARSIKTNKLGVDVKSQLISLGRTLYRLIYGSSESPGLKVSGVFHGN